MIISIIKRILNDSLYRNSLFLMGSNLVIAGLGFVFWKINTSLFSTDVIGLATTTISVVSLITTISLMGLSVAIVKYLPIISEKNNVINTSVNIVFVTTISFTALFLVLLPYLSPKIVFINTSWITIALFILFCIYSSLIELVKNIFLTFKKTEYVLLNNSISSVLKIALSFIFISFGVYGLISSWMISVVISTIISFLILRYRFSYIYKPYISFNIARQLSRFSIGNYITGFFEMTPKLVLPIILINVLSASDAAYYYIDMTIASFLFMSSQSICDSLFAEGSTNIEHLTRYTQKTLKAFGLTLVPAIIVIVLFGNYILDFFGKSYTDGGIDLLRLLSISAIFIAINTMFGVIVRVKHHMKDLIVINFLGTFLILFLSYLFISHGLAGVGTAWLIGQGIMSAIYYARISSYRS